METLTDGLNHISKSEFYLQSIKHPQLKANYSTDLLFDHSFCLLFKKYEPLILLQLNNPHSQVLSPQSTLAADFSKMGYINNHQSPNDVINSYKEVIRRQDESIDSCKKEITMLQAHNSEYKSKVEEMLSEVMQLKNQLALAQAQRESMNVRQIPEEHHFAIVAAKDNLIKELEAKLEGHNQSYTGGSPVLKIAMQEELITKLEDENKQLVEEVERMKKDQEELLELLTEQDNRISSFKSRLREMGAHVEEEEDAEDELVPANMAAFDGGGEDFLN
jgi:predicted RNase H-like nuclease (RuvC/YqgF family)